MTTRYEETAASIQKPSILITSLGRTGTEFFANLFGAILPDSTCLHEPDVIQYTGLENRLKRYLGQVRRAGVWRMVVLKAIGKWTLANVSDAKYLGRIGIDQAANAVIQQRRSFILGLPGSVYVEANLGYYALLDVAPLAFRAHKAIYLVRDGREWVRSHMNWGELYGKKGLRKLFSHGWPTAVEAKDSLFANEWPRYSRFEKLCWAWSGLNAYALQSLAGNSNARLFHFERLFTGTRRYEVLNDLVEFCTSLPGIRPNRIDRSEGWLERKIHQSTPHFPAWDQWTDNQKSHFKSVCGPLMEKLGYDL